MPKKYINIKELYVKVPFKQCTIQFIVKRREKDMTITKSELQFFAKPISHRLDQNIQIVYSQRLLNQLGLYLIAINSSNRVVNIGCINLCLSDNFIDKKQYLRGIVEQKGFIIFSLTDEPPPNANNMKNYKLSTSSKHSIKSREDSNISEDEKNKNKNELKEEVERQQSQVENYLNRPINSEISDKQQTEKDRPLVNQITPKQNNNEDRYQQASKNQISIDPIQRSNLADDFEQPPQKISDVNSFMIQLLNHKLKNAEYKKILLENQIFQMEQKSRIATFTESHKK